jgi:WD40 repeat protein
VNKGRAILTGSIEGSIKITDVDTGSEIARLAKIRPMEQVNRVVNLTESTIASGQSNGFIKNINDMRNNRKTKIPVFDIETAACTGFSKNSKFLKIVEWEILLVSTR